MLYKELLNGGSAISALLAAFFWFVSAYKPIPSDGGFYTTLRTSSERNFWAALFAGISALLNFFS